MEFISKQEIIAYAEKRRGICSKIKEIIVEQLSLDLPPDFIADNQPLFGRGLELDSIDALELAVGIYNEYYITVQDGDTDVFSSVNTMADYIMEHYNEDMDVSDNDDDEFDLD